MFGPTTVTLFLDKTFIIGLIGLVAATCGCIMLKSSIEKFINGGGSHDRFARIKGLLLMAIATTLIVTSISIIIEPTKAIKIFSHYLGSNFFALFQPK